MCDLLHQKMSPALGTPSSRGVRQLIALVNMLCAGGICFSTAFCPRPNRSAQTDVQCTHGAPLCRPVVAAAHSLAQLAALAATAFAQTGSTPPWLLRQVDAGCTALGSCAVLSRHVAQLSTQTAYRLGAACSLGLGPGRMFLETSMAAVQLIPTLDADLGFASVCLVQVLALAENMSGVLSPEHQPQASAAFASSAAKPAALLPWLATFTRAVPIVVARAGQGE